MAWEELHVVSEKLAGWMVTNMSRWNSGQVVEAARSSVCAGGGCLIFNIGLYSAILGYMWPMICRVEISESEPRKNKQEK